jgi:ubiquinone/menaquinone biosynthesis C-methylase UbiE
VATQRKEDPGYPEDAAGRLELIWGEGFLSPGGPAEVARLLGNHAITNCSVLDIGSGTGGVDVALVQNHGAGTVVGIDVEKRLVDLATSRAHALHLSHRIKYQLVKPGLLPFKSQTFDVVFSKDAIIHVPKKEDIYAESLRVLRPGGRLLVSDWLRGDGENVAQRVQEFIAASGHDFTLLSLREIGNIVENLGFIEIELVDRQSWYLKEAISELEKLHGPLKQVFIERWGEKALADEIGFWEVLVAALEEGAMRPGHIRAMKPQKM